MDNNNQRRFPRQNEETAVQVFLNPDYCQSRYDSRSFIPAKICNQSAEGFNIVIDRVLPPGSNVSIRMVQPEGGRPQNPYYQRDGLVVWCKKVDDETSRFEVGIKILRKVVQSNVLTSRFR
jgi:hypothetical protein